MVCSASLHVCGSTSCVSVCEEVRDLCPQNHSIAYIIKPKLTGPAGELARLRALNLQSATVRSPAPPPELSLQAVSSCVGLCYFRGFFPIKHVNIDCLLWIDIKNSIGKLSFTFFNLLLDVDDKHVIGTSVLFSYFTVSSLNANPKAGGELRCAWLACTKTGKWEWFIINIPATLKIIVYPFVSQTVSVL